MRPEDVKYIVVHCSATPPSMDIGAPEIRRWHRAKGWFDIGYHAVVRRNGDLEFGRPLNRPGAHVGTELNKVSIGVCLVGGVTEHSDPEKRVPENNFTGDQLLELNELLLELTKRFPNAEILGHRDLPGVDKACPCFDVKHWWHV